MKLLTVLGRPADTALEKGSKNISSNDGLN